MKCINQFLGKPCGSCEFAAKYPRRKRDRFRNHLFLTSWHCFPIWKNWLHCLLGRHIWTPAIEGHPYCSNCGDRLLNIVCG